ncbi:pinensin family lanthipeptide [Fulvivirga sp. 29W222]|uniref:Pinensin family lanthipeptide n=1 Tax=Fulvivirga marina TaxID=2494733 RepID=A0A937KDX1_9BACT|nr:pinensin family lanthipeptide [Fulvivirga marina]MBL6449551.1 pinensin family lanthipeptide [Fulvivirga marina]
MKKRNLKLESLKIKSFITSEESKHIKGAGSEVEPTTTMPYRVSSLKIYCKSI